MNKDNQTIHDFDYSLICEYFSSTDRQGPGSEETTLQALSFIDDLDNHSTIADLGCGTGTPTITLAQHTLGKITALDLFPAFINRLNERCRAKHLEQRVNGIVGDMRNLPFDKSSLDLIWSEGAIYNIGFRRGLAEWRRFLKPNGFIAITDATWLKQEQPAEIKDFWNEAYPEIDTLENKVSQMEAAGYTVIATITLPSHCWIDNYYSPQRIIQQNFLKRHSDNPAAADLVENQRREAELYLRYQHYYGYVFYIGRKC